MKNSVRLFTFVGLLSLCFSLSAQEVDPGMLTLEKIYKSHEFNSERMGRMAWLGDGSSYTALEYSADRSGRELVKYNTKTGKKEVLVTSKEFIPGGEEKPLSIDNYTWSPEGDRLLLFANTSRVWRTNSKGDYWILDLAGKELKQIGKFADPSNLKFAKFSPDGKKVAYVYYNNIYVEVPGSGEITQLTDNGSATMINGTFDWVYEEEFHMKDGFKWSPDGKHIAYWQMDASVIREFYMINNTDSLYPYIITVPYPKVGQKLSKCRIGVMPAVGGETVWMKTGEDLRNNYIPRMEWAANSHEIVFQYMNRLQNQNQVMLGDIRTGNVRSVFTDTDKAWLEVVDDFMWIEDGAYFTWISERSGWKHIYLVSREGKEIKPITNGEYDVISIELIDEKGGYVYFIASPESPTERYLFRTKLSGGEPEKLSPAEAGHHSYDIAPNARWAVHTYSNFDTPPVIGLVSLPKHKTERVLVDNEKLKAALAGVKTGESEFFRVDIGDGVELDGWIMKPWNFDPVKKYPVLFFVYGEPWNSTVQNSYGKRNLWYHLLNQKGYIVMSVDNRGTKVPRGRDWKRSIYKQIGVLAAADQAAVAEIIGKWDFIDENRLAIWGWSGGGSMTLNAMLQYPDIYHTGISVASVPDQRLYDAIYQERYMQTPELNPEGFKKGSPITYAKNLKGNLLIIHGTGDDNVHYQGMERLMNEFIKYNKQFSMMAYPNRSHSIREGSGTTLHLYTLMTNYLLDKMPPN
ncbi:MAG TPA: S9 family peptidase [Bacteroides sp.]|nr:S9 family peptidase [Bacteroides sp.]